MKRLLALLLLTIPALAEPFPAAGRWKIYHTDNTPILVTLYPDHKAVNDWGGGTKGSWKWVDGKLVMRWKDGWRDVVSLQEGRYTKAGYAPDNRNQTNPSNETRAYRLGE